MVALEFTFHLKTWQAIQSSFTSTGRLPADVFEGPLDVMEGCWDDKDLKKLSVNSCIGLWNMNDGERYSVRSSPDNEKGEGPNTGRSLSMKGARSTTTSSGPKCWTTPA